jgi:hypothetical protein
VAKWRYPKNGVIFLSEAFPYQPSECIVNGFLRGETFLRGLGNSAPIGNAN